MSLPIINIHALSISFPIKCFKAFVLSPHSSSSFLCFQTNMGGNSPCASCKLLRRRCVKDCVFAPYFPSDDPHKFAIVHKVFGASNVSKMLQELPVYQRADAVSSLVYEANARLRDPVYGCVGAISVLQNQVSQLQTQLAMAQTEILCIQMQQESLLSTQTPQITDLNDKSFLLQDNFNLDHHQYLNFTTSSSSPIDNNVIHDTLKRESRFEYDIDMVSY